MLLGKDDIFKAVRENLATEDVGLPGGGTLRVRELTGKERDAYEASFMKERPVLDAAGKPIRGRTQMVRDLSNMRAKLVARTVIDEDGNRVFSDGDAANLGEGSGFQLDLIYEVAARLSRLNEDDVENAAGNSGAAPSGDSPSA